MGEAIQLAPNNSATNHPDGLFPMGTGQCQFVVDISSDDETHLLEEPKFGGSDNEWLQRLVLLGDDSMAAGGGGLDDVVVVKEVNAKPKNSTPKAVDDDDDDDDCVIMDGDPDNPVVVNDDVADGGSDDVHIVGEKGQIACRDYPHPRHLCVRFPFHDASHEKHCNLCHCYVCDSPAPCTYWGTGALSTDHCHATDKKEEWKLQRNMLKVPKIAPKLVSRFRSGSVSIASWANPASPAGRPTVPPNSLHVQSSTVSSSFPGSTCQARGSPLGNTGHPQGNMVHSLMVPRHPTLISNSVNSRGGAHKQGNLRQYSLPAVPAVFKRNGALRSIVIDRGGFGPTNIHRIASHGGSGSMQRPSVPPSIRQIQYSTQRRLQPLVMSISSKEVLPIQINCHRNYEGMTQCQTQVPPPLSSGSTNVPSPWLIDSQTNQQSFQLPVGGGTLDIAAATLAENDSDDQFPAITAADIERWLLDDQPAPYSNPSVVDTRQIFDFEDLFDDSGLLGD